MAAELVITSHQIIEPIVFDGEFIFIKTDDGWELESKNGYEMTIYIEKDSAAVDIRRSPTCRIWTKHDDPDGDIASEYEITIRGHFTVLHEQQKFFYDSYE